MEAKDRAGCIVFDTLQSLEKFFGESMAERDTIVNLG
jgi:hypothetical protein